MINLSTEQNNVQTLYSRFFIKDNLIVNRRYQRKLIWSLEEKQKLIESILNGFPIPNILLAAKKESQSREGEERREIIDGMQRLHTIMSFIQQDFAYNGKYFNIECFPTAKNHIKNKGLELKPQLKSSSYLSDEQCGKILDYSLSTLVMRDVTNEIVDEVFSRINTYGRRLSDQERRQAGVQTIFANLVRRLSVKIRGDFCYTNGDSILSLLNLDENSISLSQMPEISIDLPRSKFGYGIAAENTFWCKHNILRAQDLRDSADEQCIADIVASIVLNEPLARDKESLDRLYTDNPDASINVRLAGEAAGNKIYDEILFCFERLEALCDRNGKKLRELIGIKESNNSIPALFANILIAMYKLFFEEKKEISDYKLLGSKLIEATKGSVNKKTSDKRNSSINMIKACIDSAFQGEIDMNEVFKSINLNKMEVEVEGIIAQAVEQARFEFKQGCLSLNPSNRMSNQKQFFEKIMHTICAIANTAEHGAIIVGVADTESDAKRIEELDEIQSRAVRSKKVVGIDREARALSTAYKSRERYLEEYMNLWKNQIQNSDLSKELKISVLSSLKYLPYYGLGLIVIDIPKQSNYSCVGDKIYFRCVDSTSKIGDVVVAATHEEIAGVVKKFQ